MKAGILILVYLTKLICAETLLQDLKDAQKSTVFVFSTIRHGARAPYSYVNDDRVDILGNKWEINAQELTNLGIRQLYILGLYQREKYGELLKSPNPGELYAMSTDKNRTIQSFLAHYQGLYPEGEDIKENQRTRAVPPGQLPSSVQDLVNDQNYLSAIGKKTSVLAYHTLEDAKNYHNLFYKVNGVQNCKGYPDYEKDNNDRIKQVIMKLYNSNKADLEKNNIIVDEKNPTASRAKLFKFADAYIANYFEGNDVAKDKALFENLSDFYYHDISEGIYGDSEAKLARINKSKVLRNLIQYLNYRSNPKNTEYTTANPKMVLYTWHDVDISEIMQVLNYAFPENKMDFMATYSSFLNFELNVDADKKYTVSVVMNAKQMFEHPLDKFITQLEKVLLSDKEITDFCGLGSKANDNTQTSEPSNTPYIIAISIISVVIVGLLVFIIVSCIKRKNEGNIEVNVALTD